MTNTLVMDFFSWCFFLFLLPASFSPKLEFLPGFVSTDQPWRASPFLVGALRGFLGCQLSWYQFFFGKGSASSQQFPSPYCTSSFHLPGQFPPLPPQSQSQDRKKSSQGAWSASSSSVSVPPISGIEAGPHHRHPRCRITCLFWLPASQHSFPKGICESKVPTGSVCTWSEFSINCKRNAFTLE